MEFQKLTKITLYAEGIHLVVYKDQVVAKRVPSPGDHRGVNNDVAVFYLPEDDGHLIVGSAASVLMAASGCDTNVPNRAPDVLFGTTTRTMVLGKFLPKDLMLTRVTATSGSILFKPDTPFSRFYFTIEATGRGCITLPDLKRSDIAYYQSFRVHTRDSGYVELHDAIMERITMHLVGGIVSIVDGIIRTDSLAIHCTGGSFLGNGSITVEKNLSIINKCGIVNGVMTSADCTVTYGVGGGNTQVD